MTRIKNKRYRVPTKELIKKYIKEFYDDERFNTTDKIIKKIIRRYPKNKKLEDIRLKVSLINDLYNTNVYATYKMAKHIKNINVDKSLKERDLKIVSKIAEGHKIRKEKTHKIINFYSFATKYCHWHKPNLFPIYDSFVVKILVAYNKRNKFSKFKTEDLRDVAKLKNVIKEFKKYYGLSNYSIKSIDQFLWMYGKKRFNTI